MADPAPSDRDPAPAKEGGSSTTSPSPALSETSSSSSSSTGAGVDLPEPIGWLDVFRVRNAPPTAIYIRDFITQQEAQELVNHIYTAPKPKWRVLANRRLQNWGGNPHPKGMVSEPLPPWLEEYANRLGKLGIFEGAPGGRPNHVLINEYLPGQGIMPHEDGPLYYPTVATITLSSHAILDFYPRPARDVGAPPPPTVADTMTEPVDAGPRGAPVFSLAVQRGSLLVLKHGMYTDYMHGIAERRVDVIPENVANMAMAGVRPGETYERGTRISLTFRIVTRTIPAKLLLGGLSKSGAAPKSGGSSK